MHFICHVTPEYHSTAVSCIFMGERSSQQVTTMKILVAIRILIVKKEKCFTKNTNLINKYYH